jgi:hypothetical protein
MVYLRFSRLLTEAGRPSGIISWPRKVSMLLRICGSISIAFELTNLGIERGIIWHDRAIYQ